MKVQRNSKPDYVSVVYDSNEKPLTQYPDKLTKYLTERFQLKPSNRMLDLGCGRGEFLRGFRRMGLDCVGVDQSAAAKDINPGVEIRECDLSKGKLPFNDDSFDCVFAKSVLEHFYFPEKIVEEIYRVLKFNGIVITMVPDWESVYKTFYEDYTHRTPFTKTSLTDIFRIHGFSNVETEKFRQLPLLWRYKGLNILSYILGKIAPLNLNRKSKTIKFSREVMLLCTAVK